MLLHLLLDGWVMLIPQSTGEQDMTLYSLKKKKPLMKLMAWNILVPVSPVEFSYQFN